MQVLEGTVAHCHMVWVFTTPIWSGDEKAWDVDRGMLVVVNPSSEGDCTGANFRCAFFFKSVYRDKKQGNPICFERCLGLILRPSDMTTYRQLKRKHSSTSCLSWYICECSITVMQGAPRYRRNMCCTCKAWPPRVPACDDIMQRRNGCMDSSVVPLNARTLRLS